MGDLTYEVPPPLTKPFAIGQTVQVTDRCGGAMGTVTVTRVTKQTVKTSCGREWTPNGWWRGEDRAYPFPSIRELPETES